MMSTALEELKNALGASRVQIVPQSVSEGKDDDASTASPPPSV
jgi:hypothetical protein